jgi:hypothetical protein
VVHDDVSATAPAEPLSTAAQEATPARRLPLTCSGCGAFSQTSDPEQLGYFDVTKKRIKSWLYPQEPEIRRPDARETEEDNIVQESLKRLDRSQIEALGLNPDAMVAKDTDQKTLNPGM